MKTQQDINGSYITPDGKAQIDFGITHRNGFPEFTATGYFNGGCGQCIEAIEAAYPKDGNLSQIAQWHALFHLKQISGGTINEASNMATMYKAVSFYDRQAAQFLANNGIKFRATLSDTKAPAWSNNGKHGHHYRVTLSKEGGTRLYTCQSGHNWTAKPVLSATTFNLSGEQSQSCPVCGRLNIFADSVRDAARITFDFWSSIADADAGITTVTAYDVLACISGDSYTPETFADFCAEFGYESDSIKALQTFRRCSAFAKRLRSFFTPAELEQLQDI